MHPTTVRCSRETQEAVQRAPLPEAEAHLCILFDCASSSSLRGLSVVSLIIYPLSLAAGPSATIPLAVCGASSCARRRGRRLVAKPIEQRKPSVGCVSSCKPRHRYARNLICQSVVVSSELGVVSSYSARARPTVMNRLVRHMDNIYSQMARTSTHKTRNGILRYLPSRKTVITNDGAGDSYHVHLPRPACRGCGTCGPRQTARLYP
jgi:hypothetical protein